MGYEDHSTPMKIWQTLSLCFQLLTDIHTQLHHAMYSLNQALYMRGIEALKIFFQIALSSTSSTSSAWMPKYLRVTAGLEWFIRFASSSHETP